MRAARAAGDQDGVLALAFQLAPQTMAADLDPGSGGVARMVVPEGSLWMSMEIPPPRARTGAAALTGGKSVPRANGTVALRAAGTGTRFLLERLLREAGADPAALHGPELPSHLEVTLAVAAGVADAAVGIRGAAETVDLDFVPLAWEPFELALTEDRLDAAGDLLDALGRAPAMAGMDLSDAGTVRRP